MKFGAEMGNLRVFAGGVYAVGEEDDAEVPDGVCPDGCAGEAEGTEGLFAKVMAARTAAG